jgi:hypothetical protein
MRCFGDIVNGKMILSETGEIAQSMWYEIPKHSPVAQLGAFVVMPDHVHGILIINNPKYLIEWGIEEDDLNVNHNRKKNADGRMVVMPMVVMPMVVMPMVVMPMVVMPMVVMPMVVMPMVVMPMVVMPMVVMPMVKMQVEGMLSTCIFTINEINSQSVNALVKIDIKILVKTRYHPSLDPINRPSPNTPIARVWKMDGNLYFMSAS